MKPSRCSSRGAVKDDNVIHVCWEFVHRRNSLVFLLDFLDPFVLHIVVSIISDVISSVPHIGRDSTFFVKLQSLFPRTLMAYSWASTILMRRRRMCTSKASECCPESMKWGFLAAILVASMSHRGFSSIEHVYLASVRLFRVD